MCRCMLIRMSAIARCAATPSTCDSANAVDGVDERGGAGRKRQRHEQVGAALADDIVDEEFGRRGQNEPGKPVDEHQDEAEGQPAAMRPDELPGLGPGVREVRLSSWVQPLAVLDAEIRAVRLQVSRSTASVSGI